MQVLTPGRSRVRELLKDGAQLIIDTDQAVELVTGSMAEQGLALTRPATPRERALNLDGELRRIYEAVTEECTVDEVAANAGLPSARVASGLASSSSKGCYPCRVVDGGAVETSRRDLSSDLTSVWPRVAGTHRSLHAPDEQPQP